VMKTLGSVQESIADMSKRDHNSHKDRKELRAHLASVRQGTERNAEELQRVIDMLAPVVAAAQQAKEAEAVEVQQRALTMATVSETLTGGNRLGSVLIALLTGLVTWYLSSIGVSQ